MALISHAGEIYRLWRPAAAHASRRARSTLLAQVGMREAADRPSRELAYGDVKRVELAIALANEPRLLLMDEPTAGMAPRRAQRADRAGQAAGASSAASRCCSPSIRMDVVFAYADRIIVLARGRLIADGDADDDPRQRPGARGLFRHAARPSRRAGARHERRHARGRRPRAPGTARAQILYDVSLRGRRAARWWR